MKYDGIILGSCTYNNGLFQPMESLIINLSHKGINNRIFGVFGTYGWSGGGVKTIKEYIDKYKWNLICDPIEARLSPQQEHFDGLAELAKKMAAAVQE